MGLQQCMQNCRQVIFDQNQGKTSKISEVTKVAESRHGNLDFLEMGLELGKIGEKIKHS